jgi:hypothetical protein
VLVAPTTNRAREGGERAASCCSSLDHGRVAGRVRAQAEACRSDRRARVEQEADAWLLQPDRVRLRAPVAGGITIGCPRRLVIVLVAVAVGIPGADGA